MYASTTNFVQPSPSYPPFLSYTPDHHQFNVSDNSNIFSIIPNPMLLNPHNMPCESNTVQNLHSDDDDDDNRSKSSSITDTNNGSTMSLKKRSRTVPAEEKDGAYYDKRERNNESAKRSRNAKRIKEQCILERISFLENENLRLSMENQTIRHQISQLHAIYDTKSRLLH